ncbi:CsbD family protein [mine drainage metagenome]|uniref:CsbD family protein n=1 Tax=mine drainage metagenome TaxID=410659 RepID=T0ZD67_9ZZZZ
MNNDIIKGQWSQLHGKLKTQWSKLTDDDLGQKDGHREYLVGKVQERYGIAKDAADAQVAAFERSLR